METQLPKIDNSNLWDKTYNILKEKIIHRQFSPNQKLLIPELAKQLGVSRTPIRDALNRLEMEGLVNTVPKVGTFVNSISREDVLDIMDTRLMLEFWVVDKIATYQKHEIEKEISKMEELVQLSLEGIHTMPLDDYLKKDYNMAFHLEFMKLGKNKRNIDIYNNIMNYRFLALKTSLISKDMITIAAQHHMSIVNNLKEGNLDELKILIRLHLEDSKIRLLDKIEKNGGVI